MIVSALIKAIWIYVMYKIAKGAWSLYKASQMAHSQNGTFSHQARPKGPVSKAADGDIVDVEYRVIKD